MASDPALNRRRWPRWWRRVQLAARRANFFAVMEVTAVFSFVAMTVITWFALDAQADSGRLLPTDLTATLLIGTLVPAMAILVLLGRRMALRRVADGSVGPATCTCGWCSSSARSLRSRRCWW